MKLNELNIQAFRAIRNLSLKDFQDVNLLLGDNDAGKTTVLEAVILSGVGNSLDQIVRCSRERLIPSFYSALSRSRYSMLESFYSMFPFSDEPEKIIELSMKIDETERSLRLKGHLIRTVTDGAQELKESKTARFKRNSAGYHEGEEIRAFEGVHEADGELRRLEVSEHYRYRVLPGRKNSPRIVPLWASSHLSRTTRRAFETKKGERKVVELMRLIDPDVEGVKWVQGEFGPYEAIEHQRYGEIPLFTYGDGMKKILALAEAVVSAENGILLVDEIETSLQASLLSKAFTWLMKACKEMGVQLFATTHSLEAISALADCAMSIENPEISIAAYRLKRRGETIGVKRFSGAALNQLVNGSGMDVR